MGRLWEHQQLPWTRTGYPQNCIVSQRHLATAEWTTPLFRVFGFVR